MGDAYTKGLLDIIPDNTTDGCVKDIIGSSVRNRNGASEEVSEG